MATTPNLPLPLMDVASPDGQRLDYNEATLIVDALLPKTVVSDALTTPPASPTASACYIVATPATDAWAGWENKIAAYIGGAWVQIIPQEGWVFWVVSNSGRSAFTSGAWVATIEDAPSDGTAYARKDGAWVVVSVTGGIHDLPLSFAGTPTASEIMQRYVVAREVTCAADFAGSFGNVGTNPTAAFSIDVQAAGASIGTITISSAGAFTFATTGNLVQVIAAGSLIEFIAPAVVDATITDIAATLFGNA